MTFGNVVALTALFVALGGGAYAAVGNPFVSARGTIEGCVKHGALDVVKAGKRCPKGTTSLPFSRTGPQGKTGATGARGAAGTSTAYFAYGGNSTVAISPLATMVSVLSKSGVPAGTYAITAKVNLTAVDAHPGATSQVNCQLVDVPASGAIVGDSDFWTPVTGALIGGSFEDQTTLPLAFDLTTTKTSTMTLQCNDLSNNNATASFTLTASNAEISAVQVGGLS
ncbi:MAG TPA: hypothetical protein VG294_17780 [Solirubrobacteraceae bacterium]|jgi:hypothetical protein|nr:hypothetical protein [Solirubrobacteraceae bacterium]